jgi:TP901 family phage tail tape measure protein
MNITVRVLVAQAKAAIMQLKGLLGSISGSGGGLASKFSGLDRVGSQMQWLGRQIEYNFTLPLTLAGVAAGKLALDNEAAFTRITKVYGDATHGAQFYHAELDSLQKAFVALSNQFGISQSDTLNIAADWAAAGASGLALAKSVQLTMKTMVLGEMDAASATTSLIAIQAQYGLSIGQLSDTIDILNMVENQTGISMQGLIDGFARTAGVARASGVSVRELAADLAALTPATGSAANAGNALKTIFSRLLSPTKDAADVLKLMGINTLAFSWQSESAQQRLVTMSSAFNKLSDAQKGFVSSIIASRYQVNRFEVLMREITSATGYYQKALQSTSDMTAVYKQAQSELNAVLTSNPQRLKEIWTTLQNAMADVIQPMIPLLLYFAQLIANLATSFSNLNPGVQKFILLSLVLLAAIGPIVRYLGAFQVLLFELVKAFRFVAIPFQAFIFLTRMLVIAPLELFFNAASVLIRGFVFVTMNALRFVPAIWSVMVYTIQAILIGGATIAGGIYRLWLASMSNITMFFTNIIAGIWRVGVFLWQAIVTGGMTLIRTAYIVGLAGIQRALLAFAVISGNLWRFIMIAPIATIRGLFTALIASFSGIIPALRVIGVAIFDAITGPWGIAITAVVILVMVFWKDIKQIFQNGVNFIRNTGSQAGQAFSPLAKAAQAVVSFVVRMFNALPKGIQDALIAVVRTVREAAMAVYHWFSYINPWARHSPSLVDNVTSGIDAIIAQFGKLTGIGSTYISAADDLKKFADATRAVERSVEANKYADIRKDLVALASDAVVPFDRLIKELYILEDQLSSVKLALDAQQAVVDGFKTQLDAANDALSTQKDILSAMKDAADDYSNTLAQINGDIEVLQGTQTALRQAGAGSEILGPLQQQLKNLQDQKKGINDQLTAAQKAYNDQKKLVDDLTAARDKLQKSYDDENAKLKVIQDAYDKINQRIQDITSSINDFASAAQALKDAAGKTDDTAKQFAAGAGANFGDVGGAGGIGREGGIGDQASQIDDFTKQIQDQTKKLFGMFDFLTPIKKGWNAAWGWVKKTFGPIFAYIGDFFSHLFDGIKNPLDKLNFDGWISGLKSLGDGVVGFFRDIWKVLGPPLEELGKTLKDTFGQAMKEIGPELAKFKDLWGPLQDLWKEAVPILKILGAIIGGTLLLALMIVIRVLTGALGPLLRWIIDIIKAVIEIIRGLYEFIVGVFTGNWSLAWKGIEDIFSGVWDAIWSTLKNAVLLIYGVIKGFVEAIVDFFIWLWDELVGHSIIPDMVNAIINWFKNLWNWGVSIWQSFANSLRSVIGDVVNWIRGKWNELIGIVSGVINSVKGYIDDFVNKILGIKNRIGGAFSGIFDGLKEAFKSAVNWIIGKWNNLSFSLGPFSMDTPNIPMLAAGGKTSGVAIVGEGNPSYPEYVIPTDPMYRKRAIALFEDLGNALGGNSVFSSASILSKFGNQLTRGVYGDKIQFFASGGVWGGRRWSGGARGNGAVVFAPRGGDTYHFHGDLSFPNIKSGEDAEEFVKNLRALVGS